MSLTICETNPILTWSTDCVISSATGKTKFEITDTKFYVPVVPSSTQNNAKQLDLVEQLDLILKEWLFKTGINEQYQ